MHIELWYYDQTSTEKTSTRTKLRHGHLLIKNIDNFFQIFFFNTCTIDTIKVYSKYIIHICINVELIRYTLYIIKMRY